ncbi:MAG: hypothetical protein ABR988_06660 [Terriglobales bacterium]|jgi:hypothetical protein
MAKMNSRLLALLFAVSSFLLTQCWGQQPASDAQIKSAIDDLGHPKSEHNLDIFYSNPKQSTELLIAALQPTARGHYREAPEAVWIVRALRSLTGVDFRGTTKASLNADEAHFLDSNAQGQVHFFGTWMSRNSVWVAPRDAQVAIIKKWREWFAKNGQHFNYVNDRNFDNWYF